MTAIDVTAALLTGLLTGAAVTGVPMLLMWAGWKFGTFIGKLITGEKE